MIRNIGRSCDEEYQQENCRMDVFIAIMSIIAFPKFFNHQTVTIWLQFIAMMIAIGYMTD